MPADISAATLLELILMKPDGTAIVRPASLSSDGTDGVIEYTIQPGDLDQVGTWKVQGHVVLPTGEWYSSIQKFKVFSNLM